MKTGLTREQAIQEPYEWLKLMESAWQRIEAQRQMRQLNCLVVAIGTLSKDGAQVLQRFQREILKQANGESDGIE